MLRFRARKMLGEDAVAVVRRFISQAGDVELPAKERFARRDNRGLASGEIDRRRIRPATRSAFAVPAGSSLAKR